MCLLEAFSQGGLHHKRRWERKKDCLEKRCCAISVSVGCQKAISEYFRRRKCCQRCEGKRAVIDKLETDLQNKNAQFKDLTENVEYLEKEKQDRLQEVASASMGDKHMCFSAENFRNQDKLIRFYPGIVNWSVFLQLFHFVENRCKDLKYWRSDVKVDENHQQQLRQGRPRSLSMLDEYLSIF